MSLKLIGNEDFKVSAALTNIKGLIYKGDGHPANISVAAGSFYVDVNSGNVWVAVGSNTRSEFAWKPYNSLVTSVTFDLNVMEGDVVGEFGPGIWSTASGAISISTSGPASAGSQGAGLIAGGYVGNFVSNGGLSITNIFNGSTWSISGNLNTPRLHLAGAGSQHAALANGGTTNSSTAFSTSELFNGSAWTSGNNLALIRSVLSGIGTQSAALVAGGLSTSSGAYNSVELFNGTTWSTSAATLSIGKSGMGGAGSQSACLVVGGTTGSLASSTELFNGTAWSMSGLISVAKQQVAAAGSLASTIIAGGSTGVNVKLSELFNGSAWSSGASMALARVASGSGGSPGASFVAGGGVSSGTSAELHNQSIHRKLDYANVGCANNIGIAFSVATSSTNGYLIKGAYPTTRIPPKTGLFLSRNSQLPLSPNSLLTVSSSTVAAAVSGLQTISSSVALGNLVAPGMLFYVTGSGSTSVTSSNANFYTIQNVNASANTFTIKNPVGTSTTVAGYVTKGNRLKLGVTGIILTSGTLVASLTTNVSFTNQQQMIHVGDTMYIPYGSSTTTGSFYNYGSYVINSVSITSGGGNVSITAYNLASVTEGVVAFDAEFISSYGVSLAPPDPADFVIGFGGQMKFPIGVASDDFSGGIA